MKKQISTLYIVILLASVLAIALTICFIIYRQEKPQEAMGCGVTEPLSCGTTNYNKAFKAGIIYNKTGEEIFKENCIVCHSVNDIVVGPSLKNIENRRFKKWLYKFINNSQALIKSGDTTAIKLFEEYNKIQMPINRFSKAEIDSLLLYLKFESAIRE